VTKAKETIFFQIDKDGRCRTGKVMKYNPETGRRIKDDKTPSKITWVHSLLKQQGLLKQDWELTQCLFGEHLLSEYPASKVALVESEKTAIICAAIMPRFIWLATGGKTQLGDKLEVLRGREVVAFPDIDAYDTWQEKLCSLPFLNVIVSDYLIKNATQQDIENHIVIKVRDNGCGISPEIGKRIFEPNFTTKSGGSGLGLAICQKIVEELGGQIEFTSELEIGTEFIVVLPKYQG
jgi:hypothetical protein